MDGNINSTSSSGFELQALDYVPARIYYLLQHKNFFRALWQSCNARIPCQKVQIAVPGHTRTNNKWVVNIWKDWAKWRNGQAETKRDEHFPVKESILDNNVATLSHWICFFVQETCMKDSQPYLSATSIPQTDIKAGPSHMGIVQVEQI